MIQQSGENRVWDESCAPGVSLHEHQILIAIFFYQIWLRYVNSILLEMYWMGFLKIFIWDHLPPKPQNWRVLNRYLTLTSLQPRRRTAERYWAKGQRVSMLGKFFDIWFQSCGASKFPNFCIFIIFPYKMPKMYFFVHGLQIRHYIAEWFWLFHAVVEEPRGCLLLVRFSCDIWWESWCVCHHKRVVSPFGERLRGRGCQIQRRARPTRCI